jgi:hypothetical protein
VKELSDEAVLTLYGYPESRLNLLPRTHDPKADRISFEPLASLGAVHTMVLREF